MAKQAQSSMTALRTRVSIYLWTVSQSEDRLFAHFSKLPVWYFSDTLQ